MSSSVCCPAESFPLFQAAQWLSDWVSYSLFSLMPLSVEGKIVHYFLLQLMKSSLLLFPVIYLAALVRAGLNPGKVRLFLEGKSRWFGYLAGAVLGMITPFCSCAAVPLFVGFAAAGIRRGVAVSFLVTAPLVSESGLVLIASTMGVAYAILTAAAGTITGIFSGFLFDFLEKKGVQTFLHLESDETDRWNTTQKKSFSERHQFALRELKKISIKVVPWLIFALLIASVMRAVVPSESIAVLLAADSFLAVPVAVLAGIPLYGTIGTVAPIGAVLLEKGAAAGTVLAFMLSVSGASLPEFVLIKQVMTWRGVTILFTIFLIAFTLIGLLVNGVILLI